MSDISELFQRDPLKLSEADLTAIIEKFRAARGQFNLGNMKAGSTKPATAKQKLVESLGIKLDDL